MSYNTCRFCKKFETDSSRLVKYGTRHYAHFKCYLDAGKTIDGLSVWQVGQFPYRLLKERGLLDHPAVEEVGKQARKELLWDGFNRSLRRSL